MTTTPRQALNRLIAVGGILAVLLLLCIGAHVHETERQRQTPAKSPQATPIIPRAEAPMIDTSTGTVTHEVHFPGPHASQKPDQ